MGYNECFAVILLRSYEHSALCRSRAWKLGSARPISLTLHSCISIAVFQYPCTVTGLTIVEQIMSTYGGRAFSYRSGQSAWNTLP